MIPKLIAFARARCSAVTSAGAMPSTSAAVRRWMSSPVAERRRSGSRRPRSARGCAARPASSRPRAAARPRAGTNASRIRTPSSLRIGMFCTFGFDDERRPVAAPIWLKRRMDAARARVHERRQRVDVGALQLREPAVGEDRSRQLVLRRELLEHALVGREARLGLADRRAASASRTGPSASCFGEAIWNALAGERVDLPSMRASVALVLARERGELRPRRCARPRAPCARAPP